MLPFGVYSHSEGTFKHISSDCKHIYFVLIVKKSAKYH